MKHYTIAKSNNKKELVVVNYEKLDGFTVVPKETIDYPGIQISSLMIIKPSFIEKVLKKKVKIKLNYYLKYLVSLMDDDNPGDTRRALSDIERYKDIIEYKYRKYLDDKYINILLKKISLLERELKSKAVYQKIKEEEIKEARLRARLLFDGEEELIERRRSR